MNTTLHVIVDNEDVIRHACMATEEGTLSIASLFHTFYSSPDIDRELKTIVVEWDELPVTGRKAAEIDLLRLELEKLKTVKGPIAIQYVGEAKLKSDG